MNEAFREIIAASDVDRRDLFVGTATRLGTTVQHVEKDFWVCWVLDALFNGLPAGGPRLLFKGGTSLSKGFGLISRFSEDIDITVFRGDLGQPVEPTDLEALSGKQRRHRLDAIRNACRTFIQGDFHAGCMPALHGSSLRVLRCSPTSTMRMGKVCFSGIPRRRFDKASTSVPRSRSSPAQNQRWTRTRWRSSSPMSRTIFRILICV